MSRALRFARRLACAASLALAVAFAAAPPARATDPAGIENPRTTRGEWVADMAGVLTPEARTEINAIAGGLQRTNGVELAVVTVNDVGTRTPREFATEIFNLWHVGNRERDDGVLLLIAVGPRRVEIETGYGAESVLPDGKAGRLLREFVVPHFKKGDFSGGAVAGARAIANVMSAAPPGSLTKAQSLVGSAPPESILGGRYVPPPVRSAPEEVVAQLITTGRLVVASLLALLFCFIAGLLTWKHHMRRCSKCHRFMRLLNAEQERAYLAPVENLEEQLKSVDHRVWRCDPCGACHIEHAANWWSKFAPCPKCKRRTLATKLTVVVAATHDRAGTQDVTRSCRNTECGYQKVTRERIARLEDSSSSSSSGGGFSFGGGGGGGGGGSFGGGSSGGGGAGAGW